MREVQAEIEIPDECDLPDWSRTYLGYPNPNPNPNPHQLTPTPTLTRSRTYLGYGERFAHPFVLPLGGGRGALRLKQAPQVSAAHAEEARAGSDGSCTGATVWDAGIVLAAHLLQAHTDGARRGVCLDLGAGTGVVGLAAAASGGFAKVLLSDLPSVVPLCADNARANSAAIGSTEVVPLGLRWEDKAQLRRTIKAHGPFDLIVGGDILYREQVIAPLLTALSELVTPRLTTVLISASVQHSPATMRAFVAAATAAHFEVTALDAAAQHPDWRSEEVVILQLSRRR